MDKENLTLHYYNQVQPEELKLTEKTIKKYNLTWEELNDTGKNIQVPMETTGGQFCS